MQYFKQTFKKYFNKHLNKHLNNHRCEMKKTRQHQIAKMLLSKHIAVKNMVTNVLLICIQINTRTIIHIHFTEKLTRLKSPSEYGVVKEYCV